MANNMGFKMLAMIFIGSIITIVFLGSIANQTTASTSTISVATADFTAPSVNESTGVRGRELVGSMTITNASNSDVSSYFVTTDKVLNGIKTVAVTSNDSSSLAGTTINATYTANPDGHVTGATRNIVLLIVIISALSIVTFIVMMLIKGNMSELMKMGRKR